MDAIFDRHNRIAAIREFGPSRVAEGIMQLYRANGLDMLTDEAQQALLDRLEADWRHSERLNAENRERTKSAMAAARNPGPTVAMAQAEIERAIFGRLGK